MKDIRSNREYLLYVEVYSDNRASIIGGDEGIFEPSDDGIHFTSDKFGEVSMNTIRTAAAKPHRR